MTESIIVAIITGVLTLIGVLISNNKHDAVTDAKLEILTEEVRKHNNFAQRMPVVEEQVSELNRRVEVIEKKI